MHPGCSGLWLWDYRLPGTKLDNQLCPGAAWLQPTRPWINPTLRAFTLLPAAKSLQSCPTLCNPIDGSPPGSAVPGILQARTLEWVAISFSSAWKWKVKVKSLSRVWLFATPWTEAYQAPPSLEFSRREYWSGVPLPSPTLLPSRIKNHCLKIKTAYPTPVLLPYVPAHQCFMKQFVNVRWLICVVIWLSSFPLTEWKGLLREAFDPCQWGL